MHDSYLIHHGIKGQKWGVRRFQNEDGSLTEAGRKRKARDIKKLYKQSNKARIKGNTSKAKELDDLANEQEMKYFGFNRGTAKQINDKQTAKQYYDFHRNDMENDEIDFDDEFERSPQGKKYISEYDRVANKYFNSDDDDPKLAREFYAVEEKYLRAQGEFGAQKIIEKYGDTVATVYANRGNINSGKNAVKAISDEWWVHAV